MRILNIRPRKKAIRRMIRRARDRKAGTYRQELLDRATPAERVMRDALDRTGWRYVFQSCAVTRDDPTLYIPDFRLWPTNGKRLYVELDGGYHQQRVAYDVRRTKWLEEQKRAVVVRFTNEQVLTNVYAVLAELAKYKPALAGSKERSEVIPAPRRDRKDAIPCRVCRVTPTTTKVVTYSNGARHRVWWCIGCARQVGGNPLPREADSDEQA